MALFSAARRAPRYSVDLFTARTRRTNESFLFISIAFRKSETTFDRNITGLLHFGTARRLGNVRAQRIRDLIFANAN